MTTATAPDPLGRIRNELVSAAARGRRRELRRRRVAAFVVLPAVLLAGSATAAAIGDFSTGVTVIDRLLENEVPGPGHTDFRPGPGGASEPLPLPNTADGSGATAVAYLSRDGLVCQAQGDFRKSDGAPRGSSGGGCYAPPDLARMLSRQTARCCASSEGADMRVYTGFAAGDVVALRFQVEDGASFDARLTPPWTPDAPGAEPLRLFVAVDETDIDVGGDGLQPEELELISQPYRVEAEMSDGRTVEVRTPWTRRPE